MLVTLIGVALLAKWAVDRDLFPIEARLSRGAADRLALHRDRLPAARRASGLRHHAPGRRQSRRSTSSVFFAYRAYALVPAPLAFALFVAIRGRVRRAARWSRTRSR
jgi:uncharacterized membrane protein